MANKRAVIIFTFMSIFLTSLAIGQKKNLDTSVFKNWLSISGWASITNNGAYIAYTINYELLGKESLVFQSVKGDWKQEFSSATLATISFSPDSKSAFFLKNDSLFIVRLGTAVVQTIPNIRKFDLLKNDYQNLLVYHTATGNGQLTLMNLDTKEEWHREQVQDYYINDLNQICILSRKTEASKDTLLWLDPASKKETFITEADTISSIVLDKAKGRVAYITTESKQQTIWLSAINSSPNEKLISSDTLPYQQKIDKIVRFSDKADFLFITLVLTPASSDKHSQPVDIWRYSDLALTKRRSNKPPAFFASLSLNNKRLTRLEYENEKLSFPTNGTDLVGIITLKKGEASEAYWNKGVIDKKMVIDCQTGARKELNIANVCGYSPDGKYLVGANTSYSEIICYEMETGKFKHLSLPSLPPMPVEIARDEYFRPTLLFNGWIGAHQLLVSYMYDIWKFNPENTTAAICLTKGTGQKKHIAFRRILNNEMDSDSILLISAFDEKTKKNGIINYSGRGDLMINSLPLRDIHIYNPENFNSAQFVPIRAKDTLLWLVRMESAKESPNYFTTSDFIHYKNISNIKPEANYQWITNELMYYKTLDGLTGQGMLYKPDNFDPKRKYPVIVNFYQNRSHLLNVYQRPIVTKENICIPWFVSRGYLVFIPDVYYVTGVPGPSAYNSLEGAFQQLSKLPYVDASRIGLQGHSFGGYITDYMVAHSHHFAAAVSMSGCSDVISGYLGVFEYLPKYKYLSMQPYYEKGQGRIVKTLWEDQNAYIKASPCLYANYTSIPVLLVHGQQDPIVPSSQSVEFFLSLRRLGKKAWLLQYPNEGHTIEDRESGLDYTRRLEDYFGYYLKGDPMPDWMRSNN